MSTCDSFATKDIYDELDVAVVLKYTRLDRHAGMWLHNCDRVIVALMKSYFDRESGQMA